MSGFDRAPPFYFRRPCKSQPAVVPVVTRAIPAAVASVADAISKATTKEAPAKPDVRVSPVPAAAAGEGGDKLGGEALSRWSWPWTCSVGCLPEQASCAGPKRVASECAETFRGGLEATRDTLQRHWKCWVPASGGVVAIAGAVALWQSSLFAAQKDQLRTFCARAKAWCESKVFSSVL